MRKTSLLLSLFFVLGLGHAQACMLAENGAMSKPIGASTAAAVYMKLYNHSESDRIITALSILDMPQARAELHITDEDENGVVRMRKLETLPMKPYEKVDMDSNGLHIMLFDVDKEALGDDISLVLKMADGSEEILDVAIGQSKPDNHHHHH